VKKEMKFKIMFFVLILVSIVGFVIASPSGIDKPSYKLDLVANSSSETSGEAQVLMWYGNNMQVIGFNLDSNQKYNLVYTSGKKLPNIPVRKSNTGVGSSYTNKYLGPSTIPSVVCLKEITSDESGNLGISFTYNYMKIAGDKVNQTFWLVKSGDIICRNNKVVRWNANEYLTALQTI
jgi:hypothetical protein